MSGSSQVESQQRVVSEALASLDALRPYLANGRITEALALSRDWSLTASSSTIGPRGVGSHSDPTFLAAYTARVDEQGHWVDDQGHVYRRLRSALETLEQAAVDCLSLEKSLRPIEGRARRDLWVSHTGSRENRTIECAQIHCQDPAAEGSPHCKPCDDWLDAHPDVRCVTRGVCESRVEKRAYRAKKKLGEAS